LLNKLFVYHIIITSFILTETKRCSCKTFYYSSMYSLENDELVAKTRIIKYNIELIKGFLELNTDDMYRCMVKEFMRVELKCYDS